tara:strand:+ start:1336 stop:2097 length:762 start_codon:yes stop_codon:yes gene_type:complete
MSTQLELRAKIKNYIRLRLGDKIVDVELDPEHLDMAIDQAFLRYRQRAQNSQEESYAFLDLQEEVQDYTLPNEIMGVRQIFRRGVGSSTGSTASQFEPFAAGYMNTYMLMSGRVGGMLSYELYAGYQELAMKMFGGYINFTFNPGSKRLSIVRKMPAGSGPETVVLWTQNYKPEVDLLTNHMTYPWIQDYSYAVAKYTLGEAREKFATIAGPQGGTTLNGAALKSEAAQSMAELEDELKNYIDGSQPLSFVIG